MRPIVTRLHHQDVTTRVGQALEIAVYRALSRQTALRFLGHFQDLDAHDDSFLYKKEKPPSAISGRQIPSGGRLDFLAGDLTYPAGIEVKNVRECMYPDRTEVKELLRKCCALHAVPVLIARRIPFVTFKLFRLSGVLIHETYNQLFPVSETDLPNQAKHKDLLGYHDVRIGN